MIGEEVAGPAGPKLARLLYFVGAGFICTVAINKWKAIEQQKKVNKVPPASVVHKAVE